MATELFGPSFTSKHPASKPSQPPLEPAPQHLFPSQPNSARDRERPLSRDRSRVTFSGPSPVPAPPTVTLSNSVHALLARNSKDAPRPPSRESSSRGFQRRRITSNATATVNTTTASKPTGLLISPISHTIVITFVPCDGSSNFLWSKNRHTFRL